MNDQMRRTPPDRAGRLPAPRAVLVPRSRLAPLAIALPLVLGLWLTIGLPILAEVSGTAGGGGPMRDFLFGARGDRWVTRLGRRQARPGSGHRGCRGRRPEDRARGAPGADPRSGPPSTSPSAAATASTSQAPPATSTTRCRSTTATSIRRLPRWTRHLRRLRPRRRLRRPRFRRRPPVRRRRLRLLRLHRRRRSCRLRRRLRCPRAASTSASASAPATATTSATASSTAPAGASAPASTAPPPPPPTTLPAPAEVDAVNGSGQAGRPETGDTVTFTYAGTVNPDLILAGWDGSATAVTIRFDDNGNDDVLTVRDASGGFDPHRARADPAERRLLRGHDALHGLPDDSQRQHRDDRAGHGVGHPLPRSFGQGHGLVDAAGLGHRVGAPGLELLSPERLK